MKTTTLAAVLAAGVAAAALATPVSAASLVLEGWAGYTWLSEGDDLSPDDESYGAVGGSARLLLPMSATWNVQLDGQVESNLLDSSSNENYSSSFLTAAHVFYREPSRGLIGLVGGLGQGRSAEDPDVSDTYFGAIEGQYYWQSFTAYGQLGYFDADEPSDNAFRNAWFGRAVGRYFIDAGQRIEGELSYANGDQDSNEGNMDSWGWGIRYDRRMPEWGPTVFVAYRGNYYNTDADSSDDDTLTEHTVLIGLNFAFGDPDSLIERDRNGVSVDAPNISRWSAWGIDVVD